MKTKKNKKYIPINKGHFQLDTQERSDAFHDKLGAGWEDEYKKYRSDWNNFTFLLSIISSAVSTSICLERSVVMGYAVGLNLPIFSCSDKRLTMASSETMPS